uniref:Uncharacterized protein n=1 Tax=Pinguiococcus pyrenoidosus TaxID=172671 RepID=A0A7R9Y8C8_9STRA
MDADQPFDHASSPAPTYGQGAGRQVDVNAYGDSDLSDLDSPTPHERDDIAPEASPSGTPMEYGAAESSDSPSTYQSASMGGPGAGVGDASRSLNAQDAFMQPSHSRSGSSRRGSAPPATSVACEEDLSDLEEDSYSPPVRQHASTAAAEKPRPPENQSAIDELSDLDLDDDDVPQARDGVGRPSPREDLEARIGLTRPSPSSAADLEVEDLDSFSNPSSSGYAKPSQSGKGQFFPLRATGGMRQQRELRGSTHGGSTDRRARPRQFVEEEEEEEEGEAEEEEERLGSDLSDLSDQEDSGPSRPEDRTIPRPAASFLRRAEEALPSPEHASRTDRPSAALPKTSSFRSRTAGFDRRTESNPRREGTTRHEMASDSDFSDLE